jgi:peptidoglycan/xylan/chitin deacetylase (PgdA/CDA1 family)
MRRMVPLVAVLVTAVALTVTGCSHASATDLLSLRHRIPMLLQHADHREAAAPAPCDGPKKMVNTSPAHTTGPFGVQRTTGSAAVALTFDDGPDPVNTPLMLDVLKACGVKATFCLIGNKVTRYAAVVRRIVAEGHTLCNHTWEHNTQLGTYGPDMIRDDLQRTLNAIHSVVPNAPVRYFRAPGGEWTNDYVTVASQLGMTSLDWDVDPWDWNFPLYGEGESMTAHIVDHVRGHVRPGSIVLSHDNQKPTTVEAYRRLLPWLLAHFTLIALPATGAQ